MSNKLEQELSHLLITEEHVVSFANQQLNLTSAEDAADVSNAIKSAEKMTTLILTGNTLGIEASERIGKAITHHRELKKYLCKAFVTAHCSLTELDLSDNALSVVGAHAIDFFLRSPSCSSLKILRLDNCGLGIAGGKEEAVIRSCVAYGTCQIAEPASHACLTSFRCFQIVARALLECQRRATARGTRMQLTTFSAGRNRLENTGAVALAKAFKAIAILEDLSLPQNGIHFIGVAALAKAFEFNPNLMSINFCDNTLGVKGSRALAEVLPKLKHLRVLNLSDSLVKSSGALVIAHALRSSISPLRELYLDGCELNYNACLGIVESLQSRENNQIGETGIEKLNKTLDTYGMKRCLLPIEEDAGTADESEEEEDEDKDLTSEEEASCNKSSMEATADKVFISLNYQALNMPT
ncbi:unnamed protein product [Soboliphyme baturini]|uniref:RanGAP1_C domain-containing protein n=1 Tax=Soboliphyme baturini TaxID=241478 RepID=A0A183IGL2_9BILA|nr:unnamed protein product [Soboliphyme baturini]